MSVLPGTCRDYDALARFHYRAGRPATFAAVYTIVYTPPTYTSLPPQHAAVAVLSYPTLSLRIRERVLALGRMAPSERHRWVNANLRTLSRVIVHPAFRSLGLAVRLVRHVLDHCPTGYTEALALMGHLHPMFEIAGMTPFMPMRPDRPVYYLWSAAARGRSGSNGD